MRALFFAPIDMLGGLTGFRVDPSATFSPTQHALAGKAALGLAQLTEQDSHALGRIPPEVLDYVHTVDATAQKADLTRKIIERYLFGTDISRIDPVIVPYTPQSVSEYPVPSGDPDVFGSQHLSTHPPMPMNNMAAGRPQMAYNNMAPGQPPMPMNIMATSRSPMGYNMASRTVPLKTASCAINDLMLFSRSYRGMRINDFF